MSIKHFATLRRGAFVTVALAGTAIAAAAAHAGPVGFDQLYTEGNVSAEFKQTGTTLTITLKNNGTTGSNADLLDGLFFNLSGNPSLGPTLPTASTTELLCSGDNGKTVTVNTCGTTTITGSWQLKGSGFSFNSTSYKYGLSAVGGNGLFASNVFTLGNGSDDYGLVGKNTDLTKKFATQFPLAYSEIDFSLTLPNGFSGSVGDVAFGFNSALSEVLAGTDPPPTTAVAEPTSLALIGFSLAGLAALRRRTKA